MDREFMQVMILTAQHDLLSAILCNSERESTELAYMFDDVDQERSRLLSDLMKKIAPNAKA